MSKKEYNKNMEIDTCPICEGKIWGKGQRIILEGARITVCQNCGQLGTKITEKHKFTGISSKPSYSRGHSKNSITSQKKPAFKANSIDDMELVSDYAKRLRSVRMAKKLNQDQFAQKLNEKPSLIRRIEAGKVKPTIKLAKKIESVYNIRLLQKSDQIEVNTERFMKKSTGSSLGDIAFIKKKK